MVQAHPGASLFTLTQLQHAFLHTVHFVVTFVLIFLFFFYAFVSNQSFVLAVMNRFFCLRVLLYVTDQYFLSLLHARVFFSLRVHHSHPVRYFQ